MKDKRIGLLGLIVICLLAACSSPGWTENPGQQGVPEAEQGRESAETEAEDTESGIPETKVLENITPKERMLNLYGRPYRGTADIGPMGDAGSVAGEIASTTENGAAPTKEGQSNFGGVGSSYTWDSGDGYVMVSLEDEWYCFYAEAQEGLTGRYCAFLNYIYGDAVYVDIVEYITDDDTDRIKELGLTESDDMPSGYYINNIEPDNTILLLDGDTSYSFLDWRRQFVGEAAGDIRVITTNKVDFQTYLATYNNSKPGMPFFFEVEQGVVQEIYEEPMA